MGTISLQKFFFSKQKCQVINNHQQLSVYPDNSSDIPGKMKDSPF